MLALVHFVKVLHRFFPTKSSSSSTFPKRNVMFLCTGNSCRSHMAQGWCWYYHQQSLNLTAYSAGTSPVPGTFPRTVNPYAIKAMLEFGIDISNHCSKNVLDLADVHLDVVITVCDDAADNCPTFQKKEGSQKKTVVVHHSFDDPPRLVGSSTKVSAEEEEEMMITYRRVCEEIRLFIRDELPLLITLSS